MTVAESQTPELKTSASPAATGGAASGASTGWRVDLLARFPALKWLVTRRWFQFAIILPNLVAFLFFIVAGIYGSPVGNRNIIIIFVWILWWFVLISVLVPFASRTWCTVCPFPLMGEWVQRGALMRPRIASPGARGKKIGRNLYFGLNWRWPKALSNIWLQNVGFLALCTFSAFLITRPIVSVLVFGGLIISATVLHLIFRQRAFCNYVCPVSGFLSLYAMTSTVEVRAKDAVVCKKCTDKSCLAGNEKGWGCPWMMYPSKMDRNNYCGLCMECIKTCPHDNMTINARPFAADTNLKGYDEAWKAFIMLVLAGTYSVIYLGPWGVFKDWANFTESGAYLPFLGYAAGLWALALAVVPGIYALAVWIGRRMAGAPAGPWRESFLKMVYPIVPLGLIVWIAFSLPLLLVNGSYILVVLSDPLGWGWDLFGTAHLAWTPLVPHWTPYLQVPILCLGLVVALRTGYVHARTLYDDGAAALRFLAPTATLLVGLVAFFVLLYVG